MSHRSMIKKIHAFHLFVGVAVLAAIDPPALAQCDDPLAVLQASDAGPEHHLGLVVASDENVLVLGAKGEPGSPWKGTAYVFRYNGVKWLEEQRLTPSDLQPGDEFGTSAAVDGDVLVVGACRQQSELGAAYVYRFNGTTWVEEQKLLASNGLAGDRFAYSVAVQDGWIAIGAPPDPYFSGVPGPGSAYVYRFNGSAWVEVQQLFASDATSEDSFGYSMDYSMQRLLVGAPCLTTARIRMGRVYSFSFNGTQWDEDQILLASYGQEDDGFGWSVSTDGSDAVVGAPLGNWAGPRVGSIYFFHHDGVSWKEVRQRVSSNTFSELFGIRVSLKGDVAAATTLRCGYPYNGGGYDCYGTMYRFEHEAADWTETRNYSSGVSYDYFAFDAAVNGDWLIATSPWDDWTQEEGSASVFSSASLVFRAEPAHVWAGRLLEMEACEGFPGALLALYVVDIDGAPALINVSISSFDSSGAWSLSATVPPGLAGHVLQLQLFGFPEFGKLSDSNRAGVAFH